MKLGICVSNEKLTIKKGLLRPFTRALSGSQDWSEKLCEACDAEGISYDKIYMDRDDWIQQVEPFDILVWKPLFMGSLSSQWFKEKIYFLQHHMHKRVVPNYETVWHFDSKIAQKYFFQYYAIPTPATFVSFNYNDAADYAAKATLPLVTKLSNGSASTSVALLQQRKKVVALVGKRFLWNKILTRYFNKFIPRLSGLHFVRDRYGYFYTQKFIAGNTHDLRITVIGDKYAYAFHRINRKNDFRASGSGNIDYHSEIPLDTIKYCLGLNRRFGFDSMCYDILMHEGRPVVVEMSYGYEDKALYKAPGYYRFSNTGELETFVSGSYWPQALWVAWIKEQIT